MKDDLTQIWNTKENPITYNTDRCYCVVLCASMLIFRQTFVLLQLKWHSGSVNSVHNNPRMCLRRRVQTAHAGRDERVQIFQTAVKPTVFQLYFL